jgi:hypothetical protein
MRKICAYIFVALLAIISPLELQAASLAGVTMPDTIIAGGKNLVLNGLGLRSKFMVKVYVAGLYLEQKSSDPDAITKGSGPKRIVMQFIHGVSKGQLTAAFTESFNNNSPEAMKTMKPDIDRLFGALESVRSGEQMVFTFIPGTGTALNIDGRDKLTIADPAFAPVLLSVWVGPKPPTADLKKGMLGR